MSFFSFAYECPSGDESFMFSEEALPQVFHFCTDDDPRYPQVRRSMFYQDYPGGSSPGNRRGHFAPDALANQFARCVTHQRVNPDQFYYLIIHRMQLAGLISSNPT